jgi:hypothetical protein
MPGGKRLQDLVLRSSPKRWVEMLMVCLVNRRHSAGFGGIKTRHTFASFLAVVFRLLFGLGM